MHRFFYPNLTTTSTKIALTDLKEIHHLKNVLRLKTGTPLKIFNGKGEEAHGTIVALQKNQVDIAIDSCIKEKAFPKIIIALACALPKKAKFEFIIEKVTELGVDEIITLQTTRTEVKIPVAKLDRKMKRFETIAINAAKQCKRKTIPKIYPVMSLTDILNAANPQTIIFIPHLTEPRRGLVKELQNTSTYRRILFLIGPEGDFSPEEVRKATSKGCIPITLGQNVLKVDTAAITVVATAQLILNSQNQSTNL